MRKYMIPTLCLLIGCSTQVVDKIESTDDSVGGDDEIGTEPEQEDEVEETETDSPDEEEEESEEEEEQQEEQEELEPQIFFQKQQLFSLPGTAWVHPVDINRDGFEEYLVTSMSVGLGDWPTFIGAGAAYVVSRDQGAPNGSLGTWSAATAFDRTFEVDWPNDSSLFDVNNDGIEDWVIGTGFIPLPNGGITWLEGYLDSAGDLAFDIPDVIPVPREDYFYHKAYPVDMDGDGDMDFVTTSYKNAETDWFGNPTSDGIAVLEWFENDGIAGQASFTHHFISENGGALMALHDIDADGDSDIVLPQYFGGSALVWMENPDDISKSWTEHVINDNTGRGFDVEIADMNNDGQEDIVYVNHNHQLSSDPSEQVMGVYWFEIPAPGQLETLTNWDAMMNIVYEGFYVDESNPDQNGAPGVMHVGDVDGDGRMDISVSGDGDDGLYLFKQDDAGTFEEILIDSGTIMAGDHHMADLDGDGDMDFIWTIYGSQDILAGQFEPQSSINVYLQEWTTAVPDTDSLQGTIDFTINTDFGPDTCAGSVALTVDGSDISGSYNCAFGVLGAQQNAISGTIDSNGNAGGTIDLTVSFDNSTYQLSWNGEYDGAQLQVDTSSAAQLGVIDASYTISMTAQ